MVSQVKHALVVYGGLELHEPQQGAEKVADILVANGFSVEVSDDYEVFGDPGIARLDLVVPVITGGQLSPASMENLLNALQNGTGMGGFHHGMATTFRDVPRFRYAAGCTWVAHPGNIIRYRVEITRPDDPIMMGIDSFEYESEQYYLHYDPAVNVLANTNFSGEHHSWRTDVDMPVTYCTHYGKGRIFYTSLGHKAAELDVPQVATILRRGLLWASGFEADAIVGSR